MKKEGQQSHADSRTPAGGFMDFKSGKLYRLDQIGNRGRWKTTYELRLVVGAIHREGVLLVAVSAKTPEKAFQKGLRENRRLIEQQRKDFGQRG